MEILKEEREESFTVLINDQLYHIPASCPHRGGKLVYGTIQLDRAQVICPLHYATFDLITGKRLAGPECPDLEVVCEFKGD
jgi:nitrite reductase (NADH) small subunit